MTSAEIKELVTTIVAALGGTTGIIMIVKLFISMVISFRNMSTDKKFAAALLTFENDIIHKIGDSMKCRLNVDISKKLLPITEELQNKYITTAQNQAKQLYAMKQLVVIMAQMMSTSIRLTEDDRVKMRAIISECDSLVPLVEDEQLSVLDISLEPDSPNDTDVSESQVPALHRNVTV